MQRILARVSIAALGILASSDLSYRARAEQQPKSSVSVTKSEPGRLGVELRDLKEEFIAALGLNQAHAIIVTRTLAGGPAEGAGIRPGDVIVELQGVAVGTQQDFTKAIQALGAGKTISLRIVRGPERLEVRATLGRSADAAKVPSGELRQPVAPGYVGLNLRDLYRQSIAALGLNQPRALLVRQALPDSPADKVGLRTGDVVLFSRRGPCHDGGAFRRGNQTEGARAGAEARYSTPSVCAHRERYCRRRFSSRNKHQCGRDYRAGHPRPSGTAGSVRSGNFSLRVSDNAKGSCACLFLSFSPRSD